MKLVREHINEVFRQDSDPISDMGIGMDTRPGTIISLKKQMLTRETGKTQWGNYVIFSGLKKSSLNIGIKGVILKQQKYKNGEIKLSIAFFGMDDMIPEVIRKIKEKQTKELIVQYSVGYAKAPVKKWAEHFNFNVRL